MRSVPRAGAAAAGAATDGAAVPLVARDADYWRATTVGLRWWSESRSDRSHAYLHIPNEGKRGPKAAAGDAGDACGARFESSSTAYPSILPLACDARPVLLSALVYSPVTRGLAA